jgi:phosphoribosylformimino-5-aminoimidazole carboxamide ribotide isomerase
VGFQLLPAIDLRGGRAARMHGGDQGSLAVLDDDPVSVAERFVADGARWIHVVDLDAALTGEPGAANVEVLGRIAALPIQVQAGGGLSPAAAEAALERGADRAVTGAAWLGEGAGGDAARALLEAHPGRVAVGLDVRGGDLAPRGGRWPERSLEPVVEWIAGLEPAPAAAVLTRVERDGSLAGVDIPWLMATAERLRCPVIASGGVGSLADLAALGAIGPPIVGAVVGRALADGVFTLRDALQAVGGWDD